MEEVEEAMFEPPEGCFIEESAPRPAPAQASQPLQEEDDEAEEQHVGTLIVALGGALAPLAACAPRSRRRAASGALTRSR